MIVALLLILQLAWFAALIWRLKEYSIWVTGGLAFLSVATVVYVINSGSNPSVKLAWVVPILVFPLFGGLLYLAFGSKRPQGRMRRAL